MDIEDILEGKYNNDLKLTLEESKYVLENDKHKHYADSLLEKAYETVLSELERYKTNNEILQGELDRIGIDTLKLEKGMSTDDVIEEIKKKDKVINEIAEYYRTRYKMCKTRNRMQ